MCRRGKSGRPSFDIGVQGDCRSCPAVSCRRSGATRGREFPPGLADRVRSRSPGGGRFLPLGEPGRPCPPEVAAVTEHNDDGVEEDGPVSALPALEVFRPPQPGRTRDRRAGDRRARESGTALPPFGPATWVSIRPLATNSRIPNAEPVRVRAGRRAPSARLSDVSGPVIALLPPSNHFSCTRTHFGPAFWRPAAATPAWMCVWTATSPERSTSVYAAGGRAPSRDEVIRACGVFFFAPKARAEVFAVVRRFAKSGAPRGGSVRALQRRATGDGPYNTVTGAKS